MQDTFRCRELLSAYKHIIEVFLWRAQPFLPPFHTGTFFFFFVYTPEMRTLSESPLIVVYTEKTDSGDSALDAG